MKAHFIKLELNWVGPLEVEQSLDPQPLIEVNMFSWFLIQGDLCIKLICLTCFIPGCRGVGFWIYIFTDNFDFGTTEQYFLYLPPWSTWGRWCCRAGWCRQAWCRPASLGPWAWTWMGTQACCYFQSKVIKTRIGILFSYLVLYFKGVKKKLKLQTNC